MQEQLAQVLEANREDLVGRFQRTLRETLFLNRAEMRPNMLKVIASDEVDVFIRFLQQSPGSAEERGAQLYQAGLGGQTVLRLGQAMRQFFLLYVEDGRAASMLELVDAYQEAVMQGYIKSLEKDVFTEQERTYNAARRANNSD